MSIGIRSLDDLFDRTIPEPNSGCWLWAGWVGRNGYAKPGAFGRYQLAHRLAYELAKGPIPKGLQIDHLCRVRSCVNPDHLRVATCQQNILCGEGHAAKNAVKTHCKWGHEFDEENTIRAFQRGSLKRKCRECNKRECREYKQRRAHRD